MTDTQPAAVEAVTRSLQVEGATLVYDVRGELRPGVVPLVLLGSPMDASGFTTLVSHFPDRVVVTSDPRNTGRSTHDQPTAAVDAEQHAADLHALLRHLDAGPVEVFASSGAAVNALVLVSRHPEDVATLVAHEPPTGALLPDADLIRAACAQMVAAYDAGGSGPAMARFIGLVSHRGPLTQAYLDAPAPDPAMFGLPAEDDGRRDDPLVANLRGGGSDVVFDLDALRAASTRIVLGVGEESGGPQDGELAVRGAYAVAAALDLPPVAFPGGHNGFLGGEYGQTGRPVEFAARLREVLAG